MENDKLMDKIESSKRSKYVDNSIAYYLSLVGQYPVLTIEEEVELFKRIEAGDKAAKELLILHNLKLVINYVKQCKSIVRQTSLTFADLIQEGNLGLERAIEKYDYRLGNKFSTYATEWIFQAIRRSSFNLGNTIRTSVNTSENIIRVKRIELEYISEYSKEPTDADLCNYIKEKYPDFSININKVSELRAGKVNTISIETPIRSAGDSILGDVIEDENANKCDDIIKQMSIDKSTLILVGIIKYITDKDNYDRNVEMYLIKNGIIDGRVRTLEETGQMYGLTRERVRQIEGKINIRIKNIAMGEARIAGNDSISGIDDIMEFLGQYAIKHNIDIIEAENFIDDIRDRLFCDNVKIKTK